MDQGEIVTPVPSPYPRDRYPQGSVRDFELKANFSSPGAIFIWLVILGIFLALTINHASFARCMFPVFMGPIAYLAELRGVKRTVAVYIGTGLSAVLLIIIYVWGTNKHGTFPTFWDPWMISAFAITCVLSLMQVSLIIWTIGNLRRQYGLKYTFRGLDRNAVSLVKQNLAESADKQLI